MNAIEITTASTRQEIEGIFALSQKNLKANISSVQQQEEGFVTWAYSMELLEKMNGLAPSVIAKDGERVVGYALTTLPEARQFHHELDGFLHFVEKIAYKGRPVATYAFYCMGQICIEKEYRGKGLFEALYRKHKDVYHQNYELLVTDISAANPRSLRAHKKVGFSVIHHFQDHNGWWDVVVWDWQGQKDRDKNDL